MSEGFGQAKALMNAPASVQKQVLSLLYSPTRGAGLTILRNEISADAGFTIEPKPPSSPTAKPSYLTLAEIDQDQGQLWFAKQIKADYGVTDVFADAWSAPAFMKSNDSAIQRRHGVRRAGRELQERRLAPGLRRLPRAVCEGLRRRGRTAQLSWARRTRRRSRLRRTA